MTKYKWNKTHTSSILKSKLPRSHCYIFKGGGGRSSLHLFGVEHFKRFRFYSVGRFAAKQLLGWRWNIFRSCNNLLLSCSLNHTKLRCWHYWLINQRPLINYWSSLGESNLYRHTDVTVIWLTALETASCSFRHTPSTLNNSDMYFNCLKQKYRKKSENNGFLQFNVKFDPLIVSLFYNETSPVSFLQQ